MKFDAFGRNNNDKEIIVQTGKVISQNLTILKYNKTSKVQTSVVLKYFIEAHLQTLQHAN